MVNADFALTGHMTQSSLWLYNLSFIRSDHSVFNVSTSYYQNQI